MDFLTLRQEIPAVQKTIYLQCGGIGPSPTCVIEEVKRWLDLQNENPADEGIANQIYALENDVLRKLAHLIGAETDEIALTRNVTDGINIVGNGLNWHAGDEIIISDQEHPGNQLLWFNLAQRLDVTVRILPVTNDHNRTLQELTQTINSRTRFISISHVSRQTGLRLPVRDICEIAHDAGVLVLLDGAQAVGNIPVNVRDIGCDAYTFSGHKWMLGPKGTGAVYVRRDLLDTIRPSWIGCHAQKVIYPDGRFELLDSARRYEFGTHDISTIGGWNKAIDLLNDIGFKAIFERIQNIGESAKTAFSRIPAVQLLPPWSYGDSSGIVTIQMPGVDTVSLSRDLFREHNISVSRVEPPGSLRMCWHCFHTPEEVERVAQALSILLKQEADK